MSERTTAQYEFPLRSGGTAWLHIPDGGRLAAEDVARLAIFLESLIIDDPAGAAEGPDT